MYPESRLDEALERMSQRRSVKAMDIIEPGPSADELQTLLTTAMRVPDHGKLGPWRMLEFSGQARAEFGEFLAAQYQVLNPTAKAQAVQAERERFLRAPVVIAVIARITPDIKIPTWEQQLSVGALCQNMIVSATLMGYAAQWLTEWYAFDEQIDRVLGLADNERVAGYIYIGSAVQRPPERVRPALDQVYAPWRAPNV